MTKQGPIHTSIFWRLMPCFGVVHVISQKCFIQSLYIWRNQIFMCIASWDCPWNSFAAKDRSLNDGQEGFERIKQGWSRLHPIKVINHNYQRICAVPAKPCNVENSTLPFNKCLLSTQFVHFFLTWVFSLVCPLPSWCCWKRSHRADSSDWRSLVTVRCVLSFVVYLCVADGAKRLPHGRSKLFFQKSASSHLNEWHCRHYARLALCWRAVHLQTAVRDGQCAHRVSSRGVRREKSEPRR